MSFDEWVHQFNGTGADASEEMLRRLYRDGYTPDAAADYLDRLDDEDD